MFLDCDSDIACKGPTIFKTTTQPAHSSTWIGLWLVSIQWVIAHRISCIFTEIKFYQMQDHGWAEAELTLENGTFQKHHLWKRICGLISLLNSREQSEVRAKLKAVNTYRPGREEEVRPSQLGPSAPASRSSLYLLVFESVVTAVNTSRTWHLAGWGEGRGKGLLGSCQDLGPVPGNGKFSCPEIILRHDIQ